jgi:hypothetical protein
MPYGISELRQTRILTESTVGCHADACPTVVERARGRFRADGRFLCARHGIFLFPSTYQYVDYERNVLWADDADRALLSRITGVKRTSERLGRERDEDALTWNVVRAFHRDGRLGRLAEVLLACTQAELPCDREPAAVYWSADPDGGTWEPLGRAQAEFGEAQGHGTEPDVALYWRGRCVIFVEAKFCASNRTRPSPKPAEHDSRPRNYGVNPHFAAVFDATYHEVAVTHEKYELMRMWLLGSWLAKQDKAAFYLVNLVRWGEELDIEEEFVRRFCRQTPRRRFVRTTWQQIWDALPTSGLSATTVGTLDAYFRNKSCGYDAEGRLQAAFTTL